jgi:hypothetical protein
MRSKAKVLLWVIILGLVAIRLSTLIDDPEHLVTPDSDCPICQAYQSQLVVDSQVEVILFSLVVLYLNELATLDSFPDLTFTIHSIRAPPFL